MLGNVEKPLVSESRRDLLLEYCLISLQKNERIKDIYGENTCDKLKFPSIGERMKKKKRKHKKNTTSTSIFSLLQKKKHPREKEVQQDARGLIVIF